MGTRLTYAPENGWPYSHDGIHDSQTHLAAPAFFYEQLRREIALSSRTQILISAVKIIFERHRIGQNNSVVGAEDVLRFSCQLRELTRTEDCIGRLGTNECVILISGGHIPAQQLMSRLHASQSLSVNQTLRISLAMVTAIQGENGLELLNRLDLEPLSTH